MRWLMAFCNLGCPSMDQARWLVAWCNSWYSSHEC
jgi:hypothetical protein